MVRSRRGKRSEVVRTLIELGAEVPAGMATGLSEQEILVAQWKAACREGSTDAGAGAQPGL